MDRKTMFRLLAAAALVLGAVAFLAIPPYAKHSPARQYTATCVAGTVFCPRGGSFTTSDYSTYANIDCKTFESKGDCGSRFWLRTGAFGIAAVAAIVLFAMAGPGASTPTPVGAATRARGPGTLRDPRTLVDNSNPEPASSPATSVLAEDGPPTPAMVPMTAEFKRCPDCAEDVRFAARKCRFCGHMFEDVTADA
jgi:hypothetical protein